jgi:hypothetical protein
MVKSLLQRRKIVMIEMYYKCILLGGLYMKSMKKWLLMLLTSVSVIGFAAGCSGDTEEDTGTEEQMEEESNTEESNTEE